MLTNITPLILTYQEAPNVGRTLEQLRWARDIVVVDSFSDDGTIDIVQSFPNARVVQRTFDNHAAQWNFGLSETGIATEWVLALDADYFLTPELVEELRALQPPMNTVGYRAGFRYCIEGRPLRSGIYTPVTVLYRRSLALYIQDGHTQRLVLDGEVEALSARILHDDRKPMSRWFQSQQRYMALEAKKVLAADVINIGKGDRIRRLRVIAPFAVFFYCLIVRGGVLDGWPGFYYAFQRMVAELLLSLYLLEHDFNAATERPRHREQSAEGSRQKAMSSGR